LSRQTGSDLSAGGSTTELFIAIDEFASWLAKEADGQALDKKACYDAWPK